MKTRFILILSLGLNVLLAAAYAFKSPNPVPATMATAPHEALFDGKERVITKVTTNTVTVVTPAKPFDWRVVESSDYGQYLANLRAIGCPERTIRDIILADVGDLFRQRAKMNLGTNRFEYWKAGSPLGNVFDEQQLATQRDLLNQKRELLKTLLGEAYDQDANPSSAEIISTMERMTGDFLKPDQQAALKQLELKYTGRWAKAAASGDNQTMKTVLAEKDAEMLAVLSPEEKFEYEVRMSPPAVMLRMSLGEFEPTEEEFRGMFQVFKRFTDQFGFNVAVQPGDTGPAAAAGDEMLNGFKRVLGPERFQQYQQRSHKGTKPAN